MGYRDYFPEGSDLSFLDDDGHEEDLKCPKCGRVSTQEVSVIKHRHSTEYEADAVCDDCGNEWHESWEDGYDL